MLKIRVPPNQDFLPSDLAARQAAARGVHALVVQHLRDRNMSRPARENGMRHSNYWAVAADATTVRDNVIEISKEGAALHYYGGVVLPTGGRKALALPKHPKVGDQNPKEYDPGRTLMNLVWPKGEKTGQLRDAKTGELLYLLVSKAKIDPDTTVLPTDDAMVTAAQDAIFAEMESR